MNIIRKKCDICKHIYDIVPDEDETDYRYQIIPFGEATRMDICPTCNDKLNLLINNEAPSRVDYKPINMDYMRENLD